WQTDGSLVLEKGTDEKALPLTLPGRGLFRINLTGKSGGAVSSAETWLAVVFTPYQTSQASPWGMFGTTADYDPLDPDGPRDAALSTRLLGASWKRLIFAYPIAEDHKIVVEAGVPPKISVDLSDQMKYAKALRDQGIFVMADVAFV